MAQYGTPAYGMQPYGSPINIGDIVDKYRVERVLGVGAMGLVAAGRHTTLDQVVAIKFLIEHKFGTPEESIQRFLAEARAAAKIESDYVCRVSDVGMLSSGIPFMIMEYLEGNDLEEEIMNRGPLDFGEACDYVLQALDAIAAAHSLGVVHRDLKPANLFLARRPDGSRRVKVLDFGISKADGVGKQRITRETRSLGTPAYMPPEQVREPMTVDHRADLWALGAILYEVITGQMAFVGNTVKEVLDRVMFEEPCPMPQLRPDVPPQLVYAVQRALTRDRDQRWPSAAMFARAISPFGSVGVVGALANVQREVGSLSRISAVSAVRLAPALAPALAPPSGTQPPPSSRRPQDVYEQNRRHIVVQGWTAQQSRKRQERGILLGVVAALFLAGAVAVALYFFVPIKVQRPLRSSPPRSVHPAPNSSGLAPR
ncbi:MAG: serine/threonine protein kinase [Labilithrix sp.]|nr:serine/threonine protein kinase [Labilithrix sp.]MCW5809617.1 serine/threonine protein kinase [Labilithrix sp.]